MQGVRLRIELVVELRGAHAERAQIVPEHHVVLELCLELSLDPHARRVRASEELVGDQAIVDAQPVRELAFRAPCGGQGRDAGTDADIPVEAPCQVAGADDLGRIALRRVRRPDIEVVAKLRCEKPPGEWRKKLLQLDVLTPVDGVCIAERVDIGLIQIPLVQVPRVAEEPKIDLALLAVDEQEPGVGNVLERLRLRRLRLRGLAGDELAAAAVGDPDVRSGRSPTSVRADTAPRRSSASARRPPTCRPRSSCVLRASTRTKWRPAPAARRPGPSGAALPPVCGADVSCALIEELDNRNRRLAATRTRF